MDIDKIKFELLKDIKDANLEKVLEKLEVMTEGNIKTKENIIHIAYNYKSIKDLHVKGRISTDYYNAENQKIVQRLLDTIKDLESDDIKKEFKKESSQIKLKYDLLKKENEALKEQIKIITNIYQGSQESTNKALKEIEGYWLEVIPNLKDDDRLFSIGRFYYDDISKEHKFDGANYRNDGVPYYEWKTWKIITDFTSNPKAVHIIYTTHKPEEPYNSSNGYSQIFLDLHHSDNKWIIHKGYFDDLGDGKPPRHFVAFRLNEIAKKIEFRSDFNRKNDFKKLVKMLTASKNELFKDLFS